MCKQHTFASSILEILAEESGGKRDNRTCPIMSARAGVAQRRA